MKIFLKYTIDNCEGYSQWYISPAQDIGNGDTYFHPSFSIEFNQCIAGYGQRTFDSECDGSWAEDSQMLTYEIGKYYGIDIYRNSSIANRYKVIFYAIGY